MSDHQRDEVPVEKIEQERKRVPILMCKQDLKILARFTPPFLTSKRLFLSERAGFSLVEMMIVFIIFFIIGGAIFATLTMGRRSWQSGNVQVEVQQEGRRGINRMVRELRQSGSATIVGVPADGRSYNSITFQIPEDTDGDGDVVDANGNVEWGSQITYSLGGLDGRQLLRSEGGQVEVLANNIANFQFRRQAATPNIIEIVLQTQKTTIQGYSIETTLNTQLRLRN